MTASREVYALTYLLLPRAAHSRCLISGNTPLDEETEAHDYHDGNQCVSGVILEKHLSR